MRTRLRIALAVSVLMFVISVGVCALSLFVWPGANGLALGFRRYGDYYNVVCGVHGQVNSSSSEIWYFTTIVPTFRESIYSDSRRLGSHRNRGFLGFQLALYSPLRSDWYCAFAVPFWASAGLSGIIGVRSWRRLRRIRQGRPRGVCAVCGYDLRATPERCPECGAVVERQELAVDASVPHSGQRPGVARRS